MWGNPWTCSCKHSGTAVRARTSMDTPDTPTRKLDCSRSGQGKGRPVRRECPCVATSVLSHSRVCKAFEIRVHLWLRG